MTKSTTILPGNGLLEEFNESYLYRWDLSNRRVAPFKNGITIPFRPFCDVLGVAPNEEGVSRQCMYNERKAASYCVHYSVRLIHLERMEQNKISTTVEPTNTRLTA